MGCVETGILGGTGLREASGGTAGLTTLADVHREAPQA